MTFSEYLNFVKIEHALTLFQNETELSVTQIALECGFGTIRNFNRVFKKLTGFSPATLARTFKLELGFETHIFRSAS